MSPKPHKRVGLLKGLYQHSWAQGTVHMTVCTTLVCSPVLPILFYLLNIWQNTSGALHPLLGCKKWFRIATIRRLRHWLYWVCEITPLCLQGKGKLLDASASPAGSWPALSRCLKWAWHWQPSLWACVGEGVGKRSHLRARGQQGRNTKKQVVLPARPISYNQNVHTPFAKMQASRNCGVDTLPSSSQE